MDFLVNFNLKPLIWLFLGICLFGKSEASPTPAPVSFEQLKTTEIRVPQPVLVRGFLYQRESGEWVLLNTPNLKSCCLDTQPLKIHVEGEFTPPPTEGVAVLLEGELHKHREELTLKNAQLVLEKKNGVLPYIFLAAIAGFSAALFRIMGKRGAPSPRGPEENKNLSSHQPVPPNHRPLHGKYSPKK